jgi:hypothetical protein
MANTELRFLGQRQAHTTLNATTDICAISQTADGTVQANRNTADASNAIIVNGVAIQYATGTLKSVQRGSVLVAGSSATFVLSSITTSNAVIFNLGGTCDNTGSVPNIMWGAVSITSNVQGTAQRGTATSNLTQYWHVSEYASGALNSNVQQVSISMGNGVTSNTGAMSAITLAQAHIAWGGFTSLHAGGAEYAQYPYIQLTGPTAYSVTRFDASGTATVVTFFTILEHKASNMKSMTRGTITIASGSTTGTLPISVNANKAFANYCGMTNSTISTIPDRQSSTLTQTSNTTDTAQRQNSDTSTVTMSVEAPEFV